MYKKTIPALLLIILLLAVSVLIIPVTATTNTMVIRLQTHHKYYSYEIGSETTYASFYLFIGEDIEWWQGGAIFIYSLPSEVTEKKIDALTRGLLNLFKDLGFITVAGAIKPAYVKIVCIFDGILEYEGFYFVDENGIVTIEWSVGKPLVITIKAKATIDINTTKYVGRADWKKIPINGGIGILWPEIEIPMPDKPVELLVVPREGFTGITTEVFNRYRNETRTVMLGGGAESYKIEPYWPGYILKDSGTFWGREPIIKIVYDKKGKHMLFIDWFWHSEIPA